MNEVATLREVHFLSFGLFGLFEEDVVVIVVDFEMVFHNVEFVVGISVDLEKVFH